VSHLRPELGRGNASDFTPTNGTAYLMIYNAVKEKPGLVHGHLHEDGESCAIGSYFDINPKTALPTSLVDEVAAVNDSAPSLTMRARKQMVMRWLRWRLWELGVPGFEKAKPLG
jgi:hypothetical protein